VLNKASRLPSATRRTTAKKNVMGAGWHLCPGSWSNIRAKNGVSVP
jgi:hypothetical protein